MEVWKDIKGYEGRYQISDQGRVKSLPKTRGRGVGCVYEEIILTAAAHNRGYLHVQLRSNGRGKSVDVHRLVAEAFIPNPHNLPQVNHINGVKTDNRVDNLEWCTNGENQLHKYRVLGVKPFGKPVICIETGAEYASAFAVMRHKGIDSSTIAACCRGKRKTAGGYHWRYAD